MPKIRFIVIALIAAFLISVPSFAQQYDKDLVVKVMRQNAGALGPLSSAAGSKDFATAVEKLKIMADGMDSIKDFTPPKGEQAAYKKVIEDFVAAANKGIEASKAQDQAALLSVIAELRGFMRQGHGSFKP
jgi:hypothetical protein